MLIRRVRPPSLAALRRAIMGASLGVPVPLGHGDAVKGGVELPCRRADARRWTPTPITGRCAWLALGVLGPEPVDASVSPRILAAVSGRAAADRQQ